MALALCELGAKIYAIDLPSTPSDEFQTIAKHVKAMGEGRGLEYISGDVSNQRTVETEVEKSTLIPLVGNLLMFSGGTQHRFSRREGRKARCLRCCSW